MPEPREKPQTLATQKTPKHTQPPAAAALLTAAAKQSARQALLSPLSTTNRCIEGPQGPSIEPTGQVAPMPAHGLQATPSQPFSTRHTAGCADVCSRSSSRLRILVSPLYTQQAAFKCSAETRRQQEESFGEFQQGRVRPERLHTHPRQNILLLFPSQIPTVRALHACRAKHT